jgi:hypothetical protein
MAKATSQRTGAPARFRLVVLDAEIPDGDVTSFNQVLQNALRPQTTVVQRLPAPATPSEKTILHEPVAQEAQQDFFEETGEVEEPDAPAVVKPRGQRKSPRGPKVVATLDTTSEVSLASFVKGKEISSQADKFLVAATWLKEHREMASVTMDHIYTCFRSLGWAAGQQDFGQTLRSLKQQQFFESGAAKGEYVINHLGVNRVLQSDNGNVAA